MILMISQPMRGKTTEEINMERKALTQELTSQGHTVIDTVFTDKTPEKNAAIYYLSKSIAAMSKVDGVVFMKGWQEARGCKIEHDIAVKYGLFVKEI